MIFSLRSPLQFLRLAFVLGLLLSGVGLRADFGNFETPLWQGTCHNVTAGVDGRLKLFMRPEFPPGSFSGYLSITGYLYGSGKITGKFGQNGRVDMTSSDPVTGVAIRWQGYLKDGEIAGEYFVAANPSANIPKQVGEWSVKAYAKSLDQAASQNQQDVEQRFKRHFIFELEQSLNKGSTAQTYFDHLHPIGSADSICVTDADLTWRPGTTEASKKNVMKVTFDALLFWEGPIQKQGLTRIRVTYNYELQAVSDFKIISTNGKTMDDTKKAAFEIGKVVGALVVSALMAQ